MRIDYKLIEGDLDKFEGAWTFEHRDGATHVVLGVDYDFGVPTLAELIGPTLQKKVRENSEMMLAALKRRSRSGGRAVKRFCFVIHPLSFDDIARYEPGAKGKGEPILRKIMEWMPPYAAVHVTGVRTPDGRETEGWFVAAPLLAEQMVDFPREEVYERVLRAIAIGAELGADVAGLGAFTGVIGDGGVTINARSPIPVTTGNSLTIAAGVASLFRGADEMEIDASPATAVVIGATGSIGSACARLIAPRVGRMILVARNETRLRKFYEGVAGELPVPASIRPIFAARCGVRSSSSPRRAPTQDVVEPEDLQPGAVSASSRCRTTSAGGRLRAARRSGNRGRKHASFRARRASSACASPAPTSISTSRREPRWRA